MNSVPFQWLQAWIVQLAEVGPVIEPPLTYSVPAWKARPATNIGDPVSWVAVPFLSRNTPPFGGWLVSAPPSPSNTLPSPKANDVGVCTPAANWVTVPWTAVGGGGPVAATAADASTPLAARVAANAAALRTRMELLSQMELAADRPLRVLGPELHITVTPRGPSRPHLAGVGRAGWVRTPYAGRGRRYGAQVVLPDDRRGTLRAAKQRLDSLDLYDRPVSVDRVRILVAGRLFGLPWFRRFDGYTIWNLILVRTPALAADPDLICHELCHVWQMQHHPVAMPLSYLRRGYAQNPYEVQARWATTVSRR